VPWIVIGAGAALFGAGVIYDAVSVQPARDRLATAETRDAYDALAPDFRSSRNVAIGLLAGGALVTGIGVALKLTVFDSKPQVSASIDHRGGVVVIGWQR
jgi:capsular polysaccharide biosynthesis protein